jgi:hypothetical protein
VTGVGVGHVSVGDVWGIDRRRGLRPRGCRGPVAGGIKGVGIRSGVRVRPDVSEKIKANGGPRATRGHAALQRNIYRSRPVGNLTRFGNLKCIPQLIVPSAVPGQVATQVAKTARMLGSPNVPSRRFVAKPPNDGSGLQTLGHCTEGDTPQVAPTGRFVSRLAFCFGGCLCE